MIRYDARTLQDMHHSTDIVDRAIVHLFKSYRELNTTIERIEAGPPEGWTDPDKDIDGDKLDAYWDKVKTDDRVPLGTRSCLSGL